MKVCRCGFYLQGSTQKPQIIFSYLSDSQYPSFHLSLFSNCIWIWWGSLAFFRQTKRFPSHNPPVVSNYELYKLHTQPLSLLTINTNTQLREKKYFSGAVRLLLIREFFIGLGYSHFNCFKIFWVSALWILQKSHKDVWLQNHVRA